MTLRLPLVPMFIACSMIFAAAAYGVQPRVFFAPAERQQVTTQRKQHDAGAAGVNSVAAAAAPATEPAANVPTARPAARLDGITIPGQGQPVAWIDGKRYENGATLNGRKLRITREGIEITEKGSTRLVRVGQSLPSADSAKTAR